MEQKNEMMITFDSRSSNESFARVAVAAFTTQLNPTLLQRGSRSGLGAYRTKIERDDLWCGCTG